MKGLMEGSFVDFGRGRRIEDGMGSGQCSRLRAWLNLEVDCGEGPPLR